MQRNIAKVLRTPNRLIHATSEVRTDFTKIKVTDTREKLRELSLKQAKERRQNTIEENRAKRVEENITIKEGDSTDIIKIIKKLSQTLNELTKSMNKEI